MILKINTKKPSFITAIVLSIFIIAGCGQSPQLNNISMNNRLTEDRFNIPPKIRLGSYASPTLGTFFLEPNQLGTHSYRFDFKEKNGIVYTCKAGHVDISHVREAADWTAYLAAITYKNLCSGNCDFSFVLKEGSVCFVHLSYPDRWQIMSPAEKENLAFDIAVRLGEYFGYTAGTWHEILTWYGYKSKMVFSEFPSAFSWEDTFSNLLGCNIGAYALRDTDLSYEDSVRYTIDKAIQELDPQSAEVAKDAAEKVRGLWFTGNIPPFVNMLKRNFDTGLGDGFVTPMLVDAVCPCQNAAAKSYPVPNLDFLAEKGFKMKLQIEPNVWEEQKILKVVSDNANRLRKYIEPERDFAVIMNHIQTETAKNIAAVYNSGFVSKPKT
ncbi:MAG: DUF4056 domain-containing protein [Phycisphaerae bacterium]